MRDHVYLIDPGRSLEDLLRCSLSGSGFVVHSIPDGDDDLGQITQNNTAAVFITVELPDKEGFAKFTQVKKIAPRVPVVLFTSTLPPTEFQLHEKLKNHADVYLDKRTVTVAEFVQTLSSLLGQDIRQPASTETAVPLGEQPSGASEETLETQDVCEKNIGNPDEQTMRDEILELLDGADGLDEALLKAMFSYDPGREPMETFAENIGSEILDVPSQQIDELNAEIELLKKEIEEVRRDARSSPFSDDFLKLRDLARSKDKEIARLRSRIPFLVREVVKSRKNYEEISKKLDEAEQDKTEAFAKADQLQRRLETAERDLIGLRQESEEAEERRASELETISASLEQERASARAAAERYEADLEKSRRQHAEAMSALRDEKREEVDALTQSHEKALTEKLEEIGDLRRAVNTLEAERKRVEEDLQERVNEAEKKYETELKGLGTKHRSELEAREEDWRSKLETLEKEEHSIRQSLENRLEKAEEEWRSKQAALEEEKQALRRDLEGKLKQMEATHRSDLENAEKRHESEKEALVSKTNAVITGLEQEAKSARSAKEELEQRLTSEYQDAVRELSREKNAHEDTKRIYEAKIHELQFQNARIMKDAELESRKHLADMEVQQREERLRAVKAVEAKWREKLEKERREHIDALSALRTKHENEIEALQRARRLTTSLAAQFTPTRLQEENEKLRHQIAKLESAVAGQKEDISRRNGIIENYEHALSGRDDMIASLKAAIEDSYRSADAHLRDRADQEETIASLKAVIEDFRRSIESYTSDGEGQEDRPPSPTVPRPSRN